MGQREAGKSELAWLLNTPLHALAALQAELDLTAHVKE